MLSRLKQVIQHKIYGTAWVDKKPALPPTDAELREIIMAKRLNHLAIVPFGNRQWALEHEVEPVVGRMRTVNLLPEILKESWRLGIHTTTVTMFSNASWKRERADIDNVFECTETCFKMLYPLLVNMRIKAMHIGRNDRIPESLKKLIALIEKETALNSKHVFNFWLDYEPLNEMTRMFQRLLQRGITTPDQVREIVVYRSFDTLNQLYPHPDFIIRTGKAYRLSGFLPWQTATSELYFPQKHFPDFTKSDLRASIVEFGNRDRRFIGD